MSTKTINEILDQQYITAKDLMIIVPSFNYQTSLRYISRIRKKMEESNYYVPEGQIKVALTWMVKKDLGIK